MTEYVEWLRTVIDNYPAFQYLIIFLGAGFGGEVAVITLGFLSAQGVFPLVTFFLVSFIGTLSTDMIWFFLGRTKMIGKMLTHRYANKTVLIITEAISKVSGGSHLLAMIFAKFLIGTRVVLIMYVAKTGISVKKFIYYDVISVIAWLLVVIPIGYVGGLGFSYLAKVFENIYAGIGFFLIFVFGIVLLQVWFKHFFVREGEEILEDK